MKERQKKEEIELSDTDLNEMLWSGGIGNGISEGLPFLSEHATTGVSDFDTIVNDFIMRSGDH
jgi:hypothetical protein